MLPEKQLIEGAAKIGVTLNDRQVVQLISYLKLIQKWNKSFNLTAITSLSEMVVKHVLDSLAVLPYLRGERTIDVGTGAGLPGMVLAICYPEHRFTLLDSLQKRIRFLNQVKLQLGLENVETIHARSQDYQPQELFDNITSRAFTSLDNMLDWTGHLLAPQGQFLAMKGQVENSNQDGFKSEVIELSVPGLEGERHLICIKRVV